MPPRLLHGVGDRGREPFGDVLGPGDRRADDDGKGAGLDRRPCACSGVRMRPSAITGLPHPDDGPDERDVGRIRHRTLHVAGQGRADDVGAEARRGLGLGGGRDVGHGEPAVAVDCGEEVGCRGRARIGGGVEGDDVGAGRGERVDVRHAWR